MAGASRGFSGITRGVDTKRQIQFSQVPQPVWWLAVFALGAGLRFLNLDATSLWIDEIYSLMVGNVHPLPQKLDTTVHTAQHYYNHYLAWQPMNIEQLLALLKVNVHMPLYYLLLNPWLGVFGNTVGALRGFSAFFSLLTLIPVYFLGKAVGGSNRAGLLTMLVMALVPYQLYYAQEGRMYALSLFLACMSALGFWKTLYSDKPLRWGMFYAISTTLGMLSHYLFVFFLGFQAVYALGWLLRFKQWKRLLYLLPAGLLLAVLAVLWLPVYQIQQQGINEDYHFAKGLVDGLRYFTVLVWQPLVVVAGDNRLERVFYIPITVLLLGCFLFQSFIRQNENRFRNAGFLLMWLFVPMLLQIGYDLLKETHTSVIDRYVLLISPAVAICLGLGLNMLAEAGKAQWVKGLAGLMMVLSLANVWSPSPFRDEHNKKDVRGKLAYMAQNAQPGDLVFVNGPMGAPNLAAWYIVQTRPKQPMLYWISDYRGERPALPDKAQLAPYKRVWLFRNRANNERGLQQAKNYLKALYPNVTYLEDTDWFLYTR